MGLGRRCRGRGRRIGATVWLVALGNVVVGTARGETAGTAPPGLSTTLSGFPTSPRAEHSLRVGDDGVGIRFRAPASAELSTVYTYWPRAAAACQVTLSDDRNDGPGGALATAMVPDGAEGWVGTPFALRLSAGTAYHLVATCAAESPARIGYVSDADPSARASGAWRLEDLGGGRVRTRELASPLFALAFDDGRWWGQPYRFRRLVRVCGANELALRLAAGTSFTTWGIALPIWGACAGTEATYRLDGRDGSPLLAGTLVQTPGSREDFSPAAPARAVKLAAGIPYRLRLRVPTSDGNCVGLSGLATDLPLGPPLTGLETVEMTGSGEDERSAGRRWTYTLSLRLLRGRVCGDGRRQGREECDGASDRACPGRCTAACTCAPLRSTTTITRRPPTTTSSTTSPTATRRPTTTTSSSATTSRGPTTSTTTTRPSTMTTQPTRPLPTSTTSTTTRPPPTSTRSTSSSTTRPPTTSTSLPPPRAYRSTYGSGYFGSYDPATIPLWPKRLGLMLGGADGEGPLLQQAKQVAAAAGNSDARFVFYFSLTSLDRGCGCFDARFYASFASAHPEWLLRDSSGTLVGAFVSELGPSRQIAVDVGNPAFIDAWADWAFAAMNRFGWDGVFADNVTRGIFYNWSAVPVNPRTRQKYTTAQYRQDLLAALRRLRARFDAQRKLFIGNHTSGWEAFDDPLIHQQITAMHGVALEGCYLTDGGYFSESDWIAQTRYLEFANRHGVLSECNGVGAIGGSASRRTFLLASYLLTKEGMSNLAELNSVGDWWNDLGLDLGTPRARYVCLDPGAGLAQATPCPSPGKIYQREWERGLVLVNPTAGMTTTIPLGTTFLLNGSRVTSVKLGPHSGAVLVRP